MINICIFGALHTHEYCCSCNYKEAGANKIFDCRSRNFYIRDNRWELCLVWQHFWMRYQTRTKTKNECDVTASGGCNVDSNVLILLKNNTGKDLHFAVSIKENKYTEDREVAVMWNGFMWKSHSYRRVLEEKAIIWLIFKSLYTGILLYYCMLYIYMRQLFYRASEILIHLKNINIFGAWDTYEYCRGCSYKEADANNTFDWRSRSFHIWDNRWQFCLVLRNGSSLCRGHILLVFTYL